MIVFDKTRGYARLIKYYFGITFDIQVWKGNKSDFLDEKKLNICFLIISRQEDLMSISYLAAKANLVFYAITFKDDKLNESFNHNNSFVHLDILMIKSNLVHEIKDKIMLHIEKKSKLIGQ